MSDLNASRTIEIALLALDLTSCGRCTGTDRNLMSAVDAVADLLRQAGTEVRVTRHVVNTAQQAEQLRFVASPTIRIDGSDIALEFEESSCQDCGELCGCNGGVNCRVWIWQGEKHLEAPKAMIVDALLKAYATRSVAKPTEPYAMPANLRNYFRAKSDQRDSLRSAVADDCCEIAQKPGCCA